MLEFDDTEITESADIKVVGVGGGGGNAIDTMIQRGVNGVEFLAANTDLQALGNNLAKQKIQLGEELTDGLGAGMDPEIGRDSALEDQSRIAEVLQGADMVFVTAGMGGGTGTGAAPVIADISRELGALTVGVATKPFHFEGHRRREVAEEGAKNLEKAVDTLITIPNQRLMAVAGEDTSVVEAFELADEVLLQAVQGISDLITVGGMVNVDFADVKTIMEEQGRALMGTGRGSGQDRAYEASELAVSSPLLEDASIEGATEILMNITGGANLTIKEVNEAAGYIEEAADSDARIIYGQVIDEDLRDEVQMTVIATGFKSPRGQSAAGTASADRATSTSRSEVSETTSVSARERTASRERSASGETTSTAVRETSSVESTGSNDEGHRLGSRTGSDATGQAETVSSSPESSSTDAQSSPSTDGGSSDRRENFIRSSSNSVEQASCGLSKSEEEQMQVPAFLRERNDD